MGATSTKKVQNNFLQLTRIFSDKTNKLLLNLKCHQTLPVISLSWSSELRNLNGKMRSLTGIMFQPLQS